MRRVVHGSLVALLTVAVSGTLGTSAYANGQITAKKGGTRVAADNSANSYSSPLAGATFEYAAYPSNGTNPRLLTDAAINALLWQTLCTTDGTGSCTGPSIANGRYLVREKAAPTGWDDFFTTKLAYGGNASGIVPDRQYVADVTVDDDTPIALAVPPGLDGPTSQPFVDVRDNRPLSSTACGLTVMLLLDHSLSIGSKKAKYKAAAEGFVDALAGTPTKLKIGSFAAEAEFDDGTNAVGGGTIFDLATPGGVQGAKDAIADIYSHFVDGTNWDAGLQLASKANVGLVIPITDGNPTVRNPRVGDSSNTTAEVDMLDVSYGIASANLAKDAFGGQKILAIGVGASLTKNNLRAISGPNEFPANQTNPDFAAITDPDDLGDVLRQVADLLCGARIHVRKLIDGEDLPSTPRAGWTFDPGTGINSPQSIAFVPDPLTTDGVEADDAIRVNGVPLGGAPGLTIEEQPTPQQDSAYTFVASQCQEALANDPDRWPNPVNGGAKKLTLPTVSPSTDWWCTFRNKHTSSPTISTNASSAVTVGGDIHDTAMLAGGFTPTGTITFKLYGPNDASCSGNPIATSSKPVAGNGNYDSDDFTTTQAGTYRWVASYSGDANNNAASGTCNDSNESVVVGKHGPSISTTASDSITVGGNIHDTAMLAGGFNPTGTIAFKLYGPNDATCSGNPIATSSKPVAGNGNYDSDDFTTTQAGTYRWVASYSGDANNAAASGSCNDDNESVVVGKKSPSITTTASDAVTVGGDIHDTAHLTGGQSPTGTITFKLYGPDNDTCSGNPLFTDTKLVSGNGDYVSANFTTTLAGTYRWIASYGGDANNQSATGACNDANESVVVGKKSPSIATTASAEVTIGGQVTDTAHLTGGHSPTGTIHFELFDNANCDGGAIKTFDVVVSGNGDYTTPGYEPATAGTYYWIASYSGDANNEPAAGACNDPNESVLVKKQGPVITTQASGQIKVGGKVHDTAQLTGGSSPTGTITFKLYGPNDANCSGNEAFSSTTPVAGNGSYDSDDFTTTQAGTYRWIASYSGDANNAAVSGACNDANESVVAFDPAIQIVKSGPAIGHDNQDLTFAYEVTNTGDIALHDVTVTDDKCSPVTGPTAKQNSNADNTLDPIGTDNTTSEKWFFTCTIPGAAVHALEDANHLIINTGTATGKDPNDGDVSDTDTHTTKIVHPAIAIDKTGPASATAGSLITYTLDVTNPGEVAFAEAKVVVTDAQCTTPVVLASKNNDPTPGTLDPGDRWTYNCSVQTKVGDTLVHNVGDVTGTDDHGNTVTSTDSADTTLVQPVPVKPASITPTGKAALSGPTGCISKTFKAHITGKDIQQVVYTVDGKKYKTVTKAPYSLKFSTKKFGKGVHRVSAKVTFTPASNTQPTTLKMVFQKCKARKIKPKFTG